MYTAVIIEDDPIITRLNARYIDLDPRFTVVKTFSSANPALVYLQNHAVDLIVLDVFMPQMNGSELLRILRVKGVNADVIMVTFCKRRGNSSDNDAAGGNRLFGQAVCI